MRSIPAIWRIDVEPDEVQSSADPRPWTGFVAMAKLVARLRERLADLSGVPVHPTWFLRLDPDIERRYGRADFVVDRYRELVDGIAGRGDPLGIHVHFYRWDAVRQVSFSDHVDEDWTKYCIDVAAGTFTHHFGEPPRRSSQGGYFLSETVVDRAIAAGIEVDVTVEPGLKSRSTDRTFGAYATAPSTDFLEFPRYPYQPSSRAVGTPARSKADARPILIVPLTSYDYERALTPWPRRAAKILLRTPGKPRPLNPWKRWPDPHTYWDLVARGADEGPVCYVALAVRTDAPGSAGEPNARALFEYLPNHPIARRLRFVDPLSDEIGALAGAQTR